MANINLRDDEHKTEVQDMLPHKVMRLSMETKNLLSNAGDIYVGTGGSETVEIEDDTYTIAKTGKVSIPNDLAYNESAILIYDKENSLQYKKSSESGFVAYNVEQSLIEVQKTTASKNLLDGLSDAQKNTIRGYINAAATSDLTFLSYMVDQTKVIVDPFGEDSGPKTTLLNNIFNNLTEAQKSYVRTNIGAGAAQSITGIMSGNGISVNNDLSYAPTVSVKLAINSGLTFDGDSSSSKGLKLNVNTASQSGTKYWVKVDSNNYPYVNVSVPSGNNQTIAYASSTTASPTTFDSNATVKLIPGGSVSMTANSTNNYIQISATNTAHSHSASNGLSVLGSGGTSGEVSYSLNTAASDEIGGIKIGYVQSKKNYAVQLDSDSKAYVEVPWSDTTYTGGTGISVLDGTISLNKGYDVPIEYQSSASPTTSFTSGTLYLIGTWTVA